MMKKHNVHKETQLIMNTQKRHSLILFFLFLGLIANAQNEKGEQAICDWAPTITTSGTWVLTTATGTNFNVNGGATAHSKINSLTVNCANDNDTVVIDFQNTHNVMFSGDIKVTKGVLILRKTITTGPATLRRKEGGDSDTYASGKIFVNGGTLIVEGKGPGDDEAFFLHGAAGTTSAFFTLNHQNSFNCTASISGGKKLKSNESLIKVNKGTVIMKYVKVGNAWQDVSSGAALFLGYTSHTGSIRVDLDHVKFSDLYCLNGGSAIYEDCRSYVSSVTMTNCEIHRCYAEANSTEGGTIMSTGGSKCSWTMTNCVMHDNYTGKSSSEKGRGGAINIYNNTNATKPEWRLTGCHFYNNWAMKESGGALYVCGPLYMENCTIENNHAKTHGGGIFVGGNNDALGKLYLLGGNTISGNDASTGYGGGIYLHGLSPNYAEMTLEGDTYDVVRGNTKGGSTTQNVYLKTGTDIKVKSGLDPTALTMGIYTETAASKADVPVFTAADPADDDDIAVLGEVYTAMFNGTTRITDDRRAAGPKYTAPETTLYFTLKGTYDYPAYSPEVPFSGDINNLADLYQYMCYVNGVNGYTDPALTSGTTIDLKADIYMDAINNWIPIGNSSAFTGTFNGNGHTISGLTIDGAKNYTDYGLFGTITTGADISGVFIEDCHFTKDEAGTLGTLVGSMTGGTISGCIGSGTLSTTATGCVSGGLVGSVTGGTIHSSSAMADITGYKMGGIAGDLAAGCNLKNSFANPKFTYKGGANIYFVGGLVAENSGTVQNCYVRFTRTSSFPNAAKFGRLAGAAGTDLISSCYTPSTTLCPTSIVPDDIKNSGTLSSDTYGGVVAPYLYTIGDDNLVGSSSDNLCKVLNTWVGSSDVYAPWKRTTAGGYSATAGDINGDYPIHKYSGYTCVASPDGINLDYAASLDDMLTRHRSDATINLYGNESNVTGSTGDNVMVYIDENVTLLQDVGSTPSSSITAYTCQTLKSYTRGERWHNFSSSLMESQIGFSYANNEQVGYSWSSDPDPCGLQLSTDDDNALFPHDSPVGSIDLYCFYEPEYHWLNFKRNSLSHWHENAHDMPINYLGNGINTSDPTYSGYSNNGNETILVPGKGYLISVDKDQLLQNSGVLNNGTVTLQNVTKTDFNEWAGFLGFNLLGNPYQSYLDFDVFKTVNASLWEGTSEYNNTFAIYDPNLSSYVQYKAGTSYGSYGATQYIHPNQGFFIRKTADDSNGTTVTYTNAMRHAGDGGAFRDEERPAYPLVNFLVLDSEGNGDIAVLELDRDNNEGALKMRMGDCTGRISLGYDGEEYGILFRTEMEDYQPLHFKASEAGTFTLTWNTANGQFSELTLIDNIAGTTTDMLSRDSYSFEANPDQYRARFKVVIGDYKDIEEFEEDSPSTDTETFAFVMGDELVVNGEGRFEVIDMLGRVIKTETMTGSQSRTVLPDTTGVYVLRLTNKNGTKVQKMVVG